MNRQQMQDALAHYLKINPAKIHPDSELADLAADSFMLIEAVVEIQETLGITLIQDDLTNVKTVGELLDVCEAKIAAQQSQQ